MALSALDDKAVEPCPARLAEVLGSSADLWHHLASTMEAGYGPSSPSTNCSWWGILRIIDEAPRYGEGTGFRIPVTSKEDCAAIHTIVEAKMS